jgi:hypothetical protein
VDNLVSHLGFSIHQEKGILLLLKFAIFWWPILANLPKKTFDKKVGIIWVFSVNFVPSTKNSQSCEIN